MKAAVIATLALGAAMIATVALVALANDPAAVLYSGVNAHVQQERAKVARGDHSRCNELRAAMARNLKPAYIPVRQPVDKVINENLRRSAEAMYALNRALFDRIGCR